MPPSLSLMRLVSWGLMAVAVAGCLRIESRPCLAQDQPFSLAGKYQLVDGKIEGKAIDPAARKAEYVFTADTITITGQGVTFVMDYKLDTKVQPVTIDMVISKGPEGTKGAKAYGIVALQGKELKLAYTMKGKRPADFSGKEGMYFLLEKRP
ncbi:MAG: TIGR03067 domain-containing protein [Gemmataceae bacterium]|nr:TIGR03067 domain-containing protein [Gemmataceae bacterium]MCS7270391.1 TIGR03067 domain-containing protein [Gemmataceae bacterium]MDW8244263.1 TIGR03067 domain-containing protein [Thermogemmata sp.]